MFIASLPLACLGEKKNRDRKKSPSVDAVLQTRRPAAGPFCNKHK